MGDDLVYSDANNRCCLVVGVCRGYVEYILLKGSVVDFYKTPEPKFYKKYRWVLNEYPAKQFAERMLQYSSVVTITARAKARLTNILNSKEPFMAKKNVEETPVVDNPVPVKGGKFPAPAPVGARVPAKVADGAVEETEKVRKPRAPKMEDAKIKVLKDNPARPGSIRAAILDAIAGCSSVYEAIGIEIEREKGEPYRISSQDIRFAEQIEFIELS